MKHPAPELLLAEIQEVIRSMPSVGDFSANPDSCVQWLGRASAAMSNWNMPRSTMHFEPEVMQYSSLYANRERARFTMFHQKLLVLLHQAESDLRLKTAGPASIGINTGRTFEYFDEVRKAIESARRDLLFIDPYLDAEFVSRYLPHVAKGTTVRLLSRERAPALKSASAAFSAQYGISIEVRTAAGFHDRYVFVDGQDCYQSGASFKDGAKKAPTVLTQITDAFPAVLSTYEQLWANAKPA